LKISGIPESDKPKIKVKLPETSSLVKLWDGQLQEEIWSFMSRIVHRELMLDMSNEEADKLASEIYDLLIPHVPW